MFLPSNSTGLFYKPIVIEPVNNGSAPVLQWAGLTDASPDGVEQADSKKTLSLNIGKSVDTDNLRPDNALEKSESNNISVKKEAQDHDDEQPVSETEESTNYPLNHQLNKNSEGTGNLDVEVDTQNAIPNKEKQDANEQESPIVPTVRCYQCGKLFNKLSASDLLLEHYQDHKVVIEHDVKYPTLTVKTGSEKSTKSRIKGTQSSPVSSAHAQESSLADTDEDLKCGECNRKFSRLSALKSHMVVHSLISKKFDCQRCSLSFSKKTELLEHVKCHSTERIFPKCSVCGMVFKKEIALRKHKLSHADKCIICTSWWKEITISHRHLVQHLREQSNSPYECKDCELYYEKKFGLHFHRKEYHSRKKKPQKCKKAVDVVSGPVKTEEEQEDEDVQIDHQSAGNEDGTENQVYKCAECKEIFFTESSLLGHDCGKQSPCVTSDQEQQQQDKNNLCKPPVVEKSSPVSETGNQVSPVEFKNNDKFERLPPVKYIITSTVGSKDSVVAPKSLFVVKTVPFKKVPLVIRPTAVGVKKRKSETDIDQLDSLKCKRMKQETGSKKVNPSKFPCRECGQVFQFRGHLKVHQRIHW